MRYQLPAGLIGVNIGGAQFNADKNGVVTLPVEGDYHNLMANIGALALPIETLAIEAVPAIKTDDSVVKPE